MPPKKTGPFSAREKVLVPHTDQMYEAKVLKCEKREDMWYYLIHYQGWGKKWDEWVEATGLYKFDPAKLAVVDPAKKATSPAIGTGQRDPSPAAASVEPMSEIPEEGSVAISEPPEGSSLPPENGGPAKRKSISVLPPSKRPEKRKKTNDIAPLDLDMPLPADTSNSAIDIRLPAVLKQCLLDDMASSNRDDAANSLPHAPSVADILTKYLESEKSTGEASNAYEQFACGLRTYFDKALYHSLLYDNEVEACKKILANGLMPSSQYGAIHLLRLLTKLPSLVPISSEGYASLHDHLASFVNYLNTRKAELFTVQESV